MSNLMFRYVNKTFQEDDVQFRAFSLTEEQFDIFSHKILNLGDLNEDGANVQALTAFFDLAGFTSFCDQGEPHLVVPNFLSMFLEWLFSAIKKEFVNKIEEGHVLLWSKLPFFAKYLGDGIMFMWDTQGMDRVDLANIVVSLKYICNSYESEFLPKAMNRFTDVPLILRCGIARGQVVSLGGGSDFVGPSINLAARLQKLGPFNFACARRGFDLDELDFTSNLYKIIKSNIRGINKHELVYVDIDEYNSLDEDVADEYSI